MLAAFLVVQGLYLYIKSGVLQGIPVICNVKQSHSRRRQLPGLCAEQTLFHLVEDVRVSLVPQRTQR